MIGSFSLRGRPIGGGSFGDLFPCSGLAEGPDGRMVTRTDLCVKIVKAGNPEGDAEERQNHKYLKTEISLLLTLTHVNIVKLKDIAVGEDEFRGKVGMVMEYYSEGDLNKYLCNQPEKKLSESQTAWTLLQLLAGVRYLHTKKVVHRDLKMLNILVYAIRAFGPMVKVTDFGLSKMCGLADDSADLHRVGSFPYMAPEMFKRRVGRDPYTVDIWSLGIMVYEMISGSGVFPGDKVHKFEVLVDNERQKRTSRCPCLNSQAEIHRDVNQKMSNFPHLCNLTLQHLLFEDRITAPDAEDRLKSAYQQLACSLEGFSEASSGISRGSSSTGSARPQDPTISEPTAAYWRQECEREKRRREEAEVALEASDRKHAEDLQRRINDDLVQERADAQYAEALERDQAAAPEDNVDKIASTVFKVAGIAACVITGTRLLKRRRQR